MPNLLLTKTCIRKCPYCFAQNAMSAPGDAFIQWDDFIYVVDFLQRERIPALSLLGGEPTVHPSYAEMLEYGLMRGFDVRTFTSGVMNERVRHKIRSILERYEGQRRITFIVNINHPSDNPRSEWAAQMEFLKVIGDRGTISFNIYKPDFELDFAFELIARYGLNPNIRLGLTHPTAESGGQEAFLAPQHYRAAAENILSYYTAFDRNRVTPDFDCGFPYCIFTDEEIGKLTRIRTSFNWQCGPIIDICPDLTVVPCFPLSHMNQKTLYDFDSLAAIRTYFSQLIAEQRQGNTGLYVECDGCELPKRSLCSGGCVAYSLPAMQQ